MTSTTTTHRLADGALLLGLAVLGWAACGATMFAGRALASMTVALVAHALLAPVFFGLGAFVYFRRRGAILSPSMVAALNVAVVIALDVSVVALLIEHSFEMFESVAGTWLPFALIFVSSLAVGAETRARTVYGADHGPERRAIDAFLEKRRLAFVGLSTKPESFSRVICAELVKRGYDVVPIHPEAEEIDGRAAYRRIKDVPEPPEAALVMTPQDRSAEVVRDCVDAGVTHVWLHRGVGPGAVSDEALALCDEHGLAVVRGQCPMMFLTDTESFHLAHGHLKKLSGSYPP